MMRFYHMTDEECLAIKVKRFQALYKAINHLEMEEEGRALTVQHNSKPGDRLKEITRSLRKRVKGPAVSATTLVMMNTPGISVEREAGSIEALRERQKAAAERQRAEWEASRSRP